MRKSRTPLSNLESSGIGAKIFASLSVPIVHDIVEIGQEFHFSSQLEKFLLFNFV
jgi:hypothetical protein